MQYIEPVSMLIFCLIVHQQCNCFDFHVIHLYSSDCPVGPETTKPLLFCMWGDVNNFLIKPQQAFFFNRALPFVKYRLSSVLAKLSPFSICAGVVTNLSSLYWALTALRHFANT